MAFGFQQCTNTVKDNCVNLPGVDADKSNLQNILAVAFAIIGAVALIYILVAALKFITSRGNPDQVAQARQSIIYGAVGLALVAAAEAIVIFVIGST